jgi:hypothetical protein
MNRVLRRWVIFGDYRLFLDWRTPQLRSSATEETAVAHGKPRASTVRWLVR